MLCTTMSYTTVSGNEDMALPPPHLCQLSCYIAVRHYTEERTSWSRSFRLEIVLGLTNLLYKSISSQSPLLQLQPTTATHLLTDWPTSRVTYRWTDSFTHWLLNILHDFMKTHKRVALICTLTSAPDEPGISSAIFLRLIPLVKFIFLEWIFRISNLACASN